MKKTAVIMAGGSGERFWPLSRRRKPKQLLPLISEKTMIEESIDRISSLIAPEDVFIITSELLLEPLRTALKILPPQNIIAEPFKRNTAPCLALAAAFIAEKYKDDYSEAEIAMAVLTADQSISPNSGFLATVSSALDFITENNTLCTIGIVPSRPETGYGYIEVDTPFTASSNDIEIKPVLKFHEKPSLAKAREYIGTGKFLWNSGMFFWRLDTFIDAMKTHLPEVGTKIADMSAAFRNKTKLVFPEANRSIASLFESFPDISIDYGLMEKAANVAVAKAMFDWDDIGSWDSLDRVRNSDENGNILQGETAVFDLKNTTVINSSTNGKIVFAGFGLEDMVAVITDDAVLVCPKSRVQEVKKCVEIIRKKNSDKWL